ncbi:MAG: hypothetical protein ACQEWF_22025 [Bacillota bacterium]
MLYIHEKKKDTSYYSYFVDVEYNRNKGGQIKTIRNSEEKILNITCDIILHSRGTNIKQDNLIAIEMKKSTQTENDKNTDRERLMTLTKDTYDDIWSYDGKTFPQHVCGYKLGVFYEVNINSQNINIEYYKKGNLVNKNCIKF